MIATLGTGKAFYQREPLTTRLKNLIRDYPEGVGIIKELVQNADDAGATHVEIVFDWRNHEFEKLPDPRMAALMGPAMLVYNNSTFTDQDFENIQRLGDSGKRETLWKTGRFGVGFNSVYHVTDYPSFISRDRIVLFDPHASAIPNANLGQPGHSWRFAEDGWWDWPDFMKVYEPGGLEPNATSFEGTIFRLPLRNPEQARSSEIRSEAFGEENIRQLLSEFLKTGEEMLLFLKSVLNIQVSEITTDGKHKELISIKTQNHDVVKDERQKLLVPLHKGPEFLFSLCREQPNKLPAVSYRHQIEVETPESLTTSTWRVTSLMRADQELFNLMQQLRVQGEKTVPWAGAAALISRESTAKQSPFLGRAYCFLPLPQETNLPVHINGFFDLDSSRRELTSDSLTGRDQKRVQWNRLLVRHVLSHAYANLIVSLVRDLGETDAKQFYSFFPTTNPPKALVELPKAVLQLLRTKRVIRSVVQHSGVIFEQGQSRIGPSHWVTPQRISILPQRWEHLLTALRLEGIDLPDPVLPRALVNAFTEAGAALTVFKPEHLRSHLLTQEPIGVPLAEAPKACLRKREWVIDLLRFCLSDGCSDLTGLPLAILEDGTLQSFGYNPPGFIYLVNQNEREIIVEQIFASQPHWFLDEDCTKQFGTSISDCKGVAQITPSDVADRLLALINPDEKIVINWKPEKESIHNATWLTSIYTYFSGIRQLPINKLHKVPLVPCNDGLLYIGGQAETPLWCSRQESSGILETLKYFEIPLVEAQGSLKDAMSSFLIHHPETIIWQLTVPELIDTLDAKQDLPEYEPQFYTELISFLAADRDWIRGKGQADQNRKVRLKGLTIYPTVDGHPTSLDGSTDKVYVPGGYEPPKIAGSLKLLRLGATQSGQEWKEFYDFLGVEVLDHSTMIQNLLEDYDQLTSKEQVEALEWIRDHLDIAQSEQTTQQGRIELRAQIRKASLLRCPDGKLRAASKIYDPRNYSAVCEVLGSQAHAPDMEIYKQDKEHWLSFFHQLGIQKTPSPDDILVYVDTQIKSTQNGVTEKIYNGLRKIFFHIEEHWDTFKDAKVSTGETLAESLKKRAWLPSEQNSEWLSRYPGFVVPSNRLYRSHELCFSNYGFRVASQKPLFKVGKLPEREFQQALGFRYLNREDVVNHFKVLIELWQGESTSVNDEQFQKSVRSIYNYFKEEFLSNRATDDNRRWLCNKLRGYKTLWGYGEFWKPEHTFQRDCPFFGKRRQKIAPESPIREVFEMLGQREQPDIDDYIAFLDQLGEESRGVSLNDEDAKCAYEVLRHLTRRLELAEKSAADYELLLLTDDNLLLPPEGVLVPDAPWHLEAIQDRSKVKVLHPEVPHSLAIAAGCRSFLESVIEQPTSIQQASDTNARNLCKQWQKMVRSPHFVHGLERLIAHQRGDDPRFDLDWLMGTKVIPAAEIKTNLMLDGQVVASGLQGNHYFDPESNTVYISHEDNDLMRHHLVESLNLHLNQLTHFKLDDTGPLMTIINKTPNDVAMLLDRLKIKVLDRPDIELLPLVETDGTTDQIFDTDILEDELDDDFVEGETPAEGAVRTTTTTSPDTNSTRPQAAQARVNQPQNGSTDAPDAMVEKSNGVKQEDDSKAVSGESQNSKGTVTKPVIRPARPVAANSPDTQNRSTTPRRVGILDISSNSKSRNNGRSQSGPGQRSSGQRRSKPGNSSKKQVYANQQYRNGVRVRSGLENDPEREANAPSEQESTKIDRAGMERVMEYERSHGRQPQDMNEVTPNHPGYDIESTDPKTGEVRYIEVKSLRNNWGKRGVCLTETQFNEGDNHQDDYWLYVVEFAETDKAKLYPIQNPVGLVGEFYYDDSWGQLAAEEEK